MVFHNIRIRRRVPRENRKADFELTQKVFFSDRISSETRVQRTTSGFKQKHFRKPSLNRN